MNNQNFDLNKTLNLALQEHQKGNYTEAKNLYEKILKINSNHFDSNFYLGTLYAQSSNFLKASELLFKAIEINPKMEDAHNNLGLIYRELKETQKAIDCIKKALEINPEYAEAYNNLGFIYKELKEDKKAEKYYLKAIEINSNYLDPYNNLGILFQENNEFIKSEKYLNKAVKINPKHAPTYINLGNLYKRLNEVKKAEEYYKQAININPKYFDAYNNLMNLYEKTNQVENLNKIIINSEVKFKNNSVIKLFKGKYLYKIQKFSEAINNLESIEFDKNQINRERTRLLFLAKCNDELENIDKAFDYFSKKNLIRTNFNNKKINKNIPLQIIQSRLKFFENPKINKWTELKLNHEKENPIFIIGFLRSGTTLLQTILRSHPLIEVIEEEPIVNNFINSLNIITNNNLHELKKIDKNKIYELQNIYLKNKEKYIKEKNNKINYIDKNPLNIIHVGEIVRVFPNAKFLLSIRHPCDCVLSCFMQNFIFDNFMSNFFDLEDSANLYNNVMKLWTNYTNFLPINYHIIKYEDLVIDFKKTIEKTLNFLELPWSDDVFKFYKNNGKDLMNNPGYDQVNKPIYTKSIGKWKKYENKISKIVPVLNPWIKKFNY